MISTLRLHRSLIPPFSLVWGFTTVLWVSSITVIESPPTSKNAFSISLFTFTLYCENDKLTVILPGWEAETEFYEYAPSLRRRITVVSPASG
jgi:hypothetical protein